MVKQMPNIKERIRQLIGTPIPLPTFGNNVARLQCLFDIGQINLSLAKLAEAHWDALAILHEAGKVPAENILYAVWAAEIPGKQLQLQKHDNYWTLNGTKMFCSGAGIVDRVLITAEHWLIDLQLNDRSAECLQITSDPWITTAFQETQTSTVHFNNISCNQSDIIGEQGWYLNRPGFWAGALGPAACWGGGAAGLLNYALQNQRKDAHTLAHLAAMEANVWAIKSFLKTAGEELDTDLKNTMKHQVLALKTRHLIEQACTDTLRRFARAYGPFPLACDEGISQRYQELDLYLRQNHAERDLEILGNLIKKKL